MLRLLNRMILLACLPGFVVSCALYSQGSGSVIRSSVDYSGQAVVHGEADKRAFDTLELPNGLRAVLISDPNADKAAAALTVNVGSGDDPNDYYGLTHFLEHMLFLGTQKYPDSSEYQAFISANGGSHNAYTAFDHTNYFFDINPDQLANALDRFAQFFVAPLFDAPYVNREVNAVHSEYKARIKNDARRTYDVIRDVVNPEHPFSKFSVGSLETLLANGEAALRERLVTFYKQHYSANQMQLVVLGKESIPQLRQLVRDQFSAVENRDVKRQAVEEPLFVPDALPMWVEVKPQQDMRTLSLRFPVPDPAEYTDTKPLAYLGNLVGHEGKGSLLSFLKDRGWAESLGAGRGISWDGGATFDISIRLTKLGDSHVDDIVTAVFGALNQISAEGITREQFAEQAALGEQQFRFREPPGEQREVMGLAATMRDYPSREVIRGPYAMTRYQPSLIRKYTKQLNPTNVQITRVSPEISPTKTSRFYDTPYALRRLPNRTVMAWQNALPPAGFSLPAPNPFIAEDLTIKKGAATATPRKIVDSNGRTYWYQKDDQFHVPKGSVYGLLESPIVGDTLKHAVLSDFWAKMVTDQLNEYAYPAALAGLGYSVQANWRGIEIAVSGFNDKQGLLLDTIAKTVRKPAWDQARFQRLKAEKLRQLRNLSEQAPYQRLRSELPRVLYWYRWPVEDVIAAVEKTDMGGIAYHIEEVMEANDLAIQVHGNFTESDAKRLGDIAAASLKQTDVRGLSVVQQIVRLGQGNIVRTLPSNHDDASMLLYMQADEASKTARAIMGLTAQMIRSPYFDDLRTEQQLGYIVTAWPYPIRDVAALVLEVQSPVASTAELQRASEQFLQRWLGDSQARRAEFTGHKTALLARLREQPRNSQEQGSRYWMDLMDGYTNFDSREQLARSLERLTFEQWYSKVSAWLLPSTRAALWLEHSGKFGTTIYGDSRLPSIPEFKALRPFFRFE